MKWFKVAWHFMLRHLPRWLHIAAHEVAKAHEGCPDCKNVPYDYSDVCCRDCDLYEDCKDFDDTFRKE